MTVWNLEWLGSATGPAIVIAASVLAVGTAWRALIRDSCARRP
jgi:hypothetical protein